MNTLVTGGAGYIGSHAVLRLLENDYAVTIVDDLSRGNRAAIEVLRPLGDLEFVESDLGDRAVVAGVLRERGVECVMHFGALAYVGESVEDPSKYYRENVINTWNLLEAMRAAECRDIVFSSTAATYGEPIETPRRTVTSAAIHTWSPITTGSAASGRSASTSMHRGISPPTTSRWPTIGSMIGRRVSLPWGAHGSTRASRMRSLRRFIINSKAAALDSKAAALSREAVATSCS